MLSPETQKYLEEVWGYDAVHRIDSLTMDCIVEAALEGGQADLEIVTYALDSGWIPDSRWAWAVADVVTYKYLHAKLDVIYGASESTHEASEEEWALRREVNCFRRLVGMEPIEHVALSLIMRGKS